MAERSNAVMDSIIEDMMLRGQEPPPTSPPSVAAPSRKYGRNYVAPRDVTRQKLGPVSQMWSQIAKQMFTDAERNQAQNPYPQKPPAVVQAQEQDEYPPAQGLE